MTPSDRRAFLKQAALLTVATATPGLLDGQGLGGPSAPPPPGWVPTPCRLCGVGCGLLVEVERGQAVAVRGNPDSPVGGGLACVKGYHAIQLASGRDRITRASLRRGGQLTPVSPGEAYDAIASRLRETVREHGKDSVALYGSAQWSITDAYVASKLFKGALGTNNVESSARLHAGSASAGLRTTFGLDGTPGSYDDIEHADTIILWNLNLAESDPVLFSRILARRRRDPAVRILEVAARTTRTSYAADRSVLASPQGWLALANGICQEIIARDRADHRFVERYASIMRGPADPGSDEDPPPSDVGTPATWDDCREFFRSYTPEHTQALCGVPADVIRWLASEYADPTRRVLSIWGADLHADRCGTWINNALYNIHLLTGRVARPGDSPLALVGQPSGGCGVHDAGSLTETLPRGSVLDGADRRRAGEIWGVPGGRIDANPTHRTMSLFRALERGDIRFLWIQATNPMLSLPNLERYRQAARRSELFIVVTEGYPTPTTDVADAVLPAAMWGERDGIYGNAERRLQYAPRQVSPPGDAAPDTWHMIEVARRLGYEEMFPWDREQHTALIWAEYCRFYEGTREPLPSLDDLRNQPGLTWPVHAGRGTPRRYRVQEDPAANAARGDLDFYGFEDGRARIWLRPHQPAVEAPDAAYPFWLLTGEVVEHWGGGAVTRRIPVLHRALPQSYVELHRDDAAALGVRDREMVRLVSRRGQLEVQARVDYRSQPPRGVLFVPGFDEDRPVQRLMGEAVCPLSGQPDRRKCAVQVVPLRQRVGR